MAVFISAKVLQSPHKPMKSYLLLLTTNSQRKQPTALGLVFLFFLLICIYVLFLSDCKLEVLSTDLPGK